MMSGLADVAQLAWGRTGTEQFLQRQREKGKTEKWELVLASDVVYDPEVALLPS